MAKVLTDPQHYTNIANAIRGKNGSSDAYTPVEMADAILAIEAGGGNASTFESVASGLLPEVVRGVANSVFSVSFVTVSSGE